MTVNVKHKWFVEGILSPVSKLADNLQIMFEKEGNNQICKTTTHSADNSVVLFAKIPCSFDREFSAVIPDCKTFLRLFSNSQQDQISLEINSNSIAYNHSSFSFKYHLLDETYLVNKQTLSETKLNNLTFDTEFVTTKQKINDIAKFNSIIPDAEKVYFFTKDSGEVYAKVGDKERANSNEIEFVVSPSFTNTKMSMEFPLNIQHLLLCSFPETDITVSVNHKLKVFKFETDTLKYIISGLIK